MANVLFVNGPASGHVYPTLGLVETLVARGEHVVYASSETFRAHIERAGASFVAYDDFLSSEDPFEINELFKLVTTIVRSYDIILPTVLELAAATRFDYIIADSMYGCGGVLAELLELPLVAVCTSMIGVEHGTAQAGRHGGNLSSHLPNLKRFIAEAAAVKAKYGIRRKLDVGNVFFNEGLLNLVFTSSLLQPDGERLSERYRFIGPCLTDRLPSEPAPLASSGSGKTVYVSMGTQFNDVAQLYRTCFAALADYPGRIILSVGSRIDLDELGPVPDNMSVHRFVDQLKVLEQADAFITHGGMNSVNESLYHGVPMIVVPMAADQPVVARRIHELGAGILLDKGTLTAETLRSAVDDVSGNDRYRMRARALGDSLRQAGGTQAAWEAIREFVALHVRSS